jgi:hypothetical protein
MHVEHGDACIKLMGNLDGASQCDVCPFLEVGGTQNVAKHGALPSSDEFSTGVLHPGDAMMGFIFDKK